MGLVLRAIEVEAEEDHPSVAAFSIASGLVWFLLRDHRKRRALEAELKAPIGTEGRRILSVFHPTFSARDSNKLASRTNTRRAFSDPDC